MKGIPWVITLEEPNWREILIFPSHTSTVANNSLLITKQAV